MQDNYTIYPAPRRRGKTSWLFNQVIEALWQGLDVAVVVPTQQWAVHLIHREYKGLVGMDVYTERTFPGARGRIYDEIFVDEANLFHDNPVELLQHVAPGVPATFTYTPYPFEQ